jgi:hypothetical protein
MMVESGRVVARPGVVAMMRLMSMLMVLAPALSGTGIAAAQSSADYDGRWSIHQDGRRNTFQGNRQKVDTRGTLVVAGSSGTWHVDEHNPRDPCIGREAPVAVIKATRRVLVIMVERSKALTGCKDFKLAFKKGDGDALIATHADGRPITIVRE